jgi:hypothetical protein
LIIEKGNRMKTWVRAVTLSAAVSLQAAAATGPSTSSVPYLIANAPGVEFTAILSAGDTVESSHQGGAYRMAGVPDGLGAYDNGDGSITVLMNHELSAGAGAVHAHGARGAFVSLWKIRKRDLKVLEGQDLIRTVMLWNAASQAYVNGSGVAFSRFCSADLAAHTAYFNRKSGKGLSEGRIFMNGEEDGRGKPRGFAHLIGGPRHGTSYELPRMGSHPFENLLASPFEQDKTIVAGTEDGGANKVYFYVGEKQAQGSPVEKAGLTNGATYELRIDGYTGDDPATGFKSGSFTLASEGGTSLARPEDGAWDTVNPNRFYFVTTANFKGNSRLWEVVFTDIKQPERGGTIRVLLDGAAAGVRMMDNVTVDKEGNVYLQEDVGNNPHLGQVWMFNPNSRALISLARHDPVIFLKGGAKAEAVLLDAEFGIKEPDLFLLTEDEESSGIIEVGELFRGVEGYDTVRNRYFLLAVQAHYPLEGDVVEGGQLLLMKVAK